MASWIVHLRLAENLLASIEGLDAPQFALGNVAPDSGIPDEKWENFDPPKEVTHFAKDNHTGYFLADLDFYREYLLSVDRAQAPGCFSFRLGYFFHLLTDNLWRNLIGHPTHERFKYAFEEDPDFIWQVKRDWYGLDFEYVRSHPDSLFWHEFLDAEYEEEHLDFLPKAAIDQQIAYIKTFYQRSDEEVERSFIQRPDMYLSNAEMDSFIAESADRLLCIYDYLWRQNGAHAAFQSALQISCFSLG